MEHQKKIILSHDDPNANDIITEHSKVAVKKIEAMGAQKEQIYCAVSNDGRGGFKVWHLTMDDRGENISNGPVVVLEVDQAHNGEMITLMSFVTISGETYLATGANLDHRVNLWRI